MKKFKTGISLFLAVLMALSLMGTAVSAAEAEPGQTVTVSFPFSGIDSLDGNFTYSNESIIKSVAWNHSMSGMMGSIADNLVFLYSASVGACSGSVNVVITLSADAKPGDTCVVTFNYNKSSDGGATMVSGSTSKTITVKEKEPEPTEPKPTEPKPTEPKPTEPKPTEPKPSEPKPTTPQPTVPEEKPVDYTGLNRQMEIVKGLKQEEYSADSWAALQTALGKAQEATKSKVQKDVDKAANDLAAAIAALVKMDYAQLQAALAAANALYENDLLGKQWEDLLQQLNQATTEIITSGDQAAVNEATAKLLDMIEQIKQTTNDLTRVEEIIQQIPVEVPPKDDFCNIPLHEILPILIAAGVALCAVLGWLLWVFFSRRRGKFTDDTPMPDYDISDDDKF